MQAALSTCRIAAVAIRLGRCDRATCTLEIHDLRHSAVTVLLAQGMTLEDVENQLGHSTIVLTSNTYGHELEQRQRESARAMDAVLGG
jgi:integrase